MQNSILVTGVNGFVGQHLAKNLKDSGLGVIGVGRETTPSSAVEDLLDEYIPCDLTDIETVKNIMPALRKSSAVINLAGIATTNNDPAMNELLFDINTGVHEVLYKVMYDMGGTARIIAVCTGLEYSVNQIMPLSEESQLQPDNDDTNAYVRTKLRVEKIADKYRKNGLDIVVVRPFNHTGPGQGLGFFVPDQIAKIRSAVETNTTMDLGDGLDFWRDFTDVRDVVDAYRLLATMPKERLSSPTYNIASGIPIFGRDLFRQIARQMRFTNYNLTIDNTSNSQKIYGSHDLLTKDTGWHPQYTLEKTISDML